MRLIVEPNDEVLVQGGHGAPELNFSALADLCNRHYQAAEDIRNCNCMDTFVRPMATLTVGISPAPAGVTVREVILTINGNAQPSVTIPATQNQYAFAVDPGDVINVKVRDGIGYIGLGGQPMVSWGQYGSFDYTVPVQVPQPPPAPLIVLIPQ